jgi:hypothetical protein
MDGNLDPEHTPPIGYAPLTSVAEFRELLTSHFEELALIAAESFAAPSRDLLRSKAPETRNIDLILLRPREERRWVQSAQTISCSSVAASKAAISSAFGMAVVYRSLLRSGDPTSLHVLEEPLPASSGFEGVQVNRQLPRLSHSPAIISFVLWCRVAGIYQGLRK